MLAKESINLKVQSRLLKKWRGWIEMLRDIERAKIELMTYGMNVSETARKAIGGDEQRPLTLADYASTSGISMVLGDNVWVNAPISDYNPNFVGETSYTLDFRDGRFFVGSKGVEFE